MGLKRVALLLAELYTNLLKTGENKNSISSQIKRDRTILRPNGDHYGRLQFTLRRAPYGPLSDNNFSTRV